MSSRTAGLLMPLLHLFELRNQSLDERKRLLDKRVLDRVPLHPSATLVNGKISLVSNFVPSANNLIVLLFDRSEVTEPVKRL